MQGFKYISFGLLLASFAMVSAGIAEAASKRSVPLTLRASDKADAEVAEEVLLSENSHTLVIGINQCING